MGRPYKYILLTSALITALLLCLDFFWLDRDSGGALWSQVLFDVLVWGGMYTLGFFFFISGIYFIAGKAATKLGSN